MLNSEFITRRRGWIGKEDNENLFDKLAAEGELNIKATVIEVVPLNDLSKDLFSKVIDDNPDAITGTLNERA